MQLTKDIVRQRFGPTDFARGEAYYREGRVEEYQEERDGEVQRFVCVVRGTNAYRASGEWNGKAMRGYCTCPRFYEWSACKHLVAGFLTMLEGDGAVSMKSDRSARVLLNTYLDLNKEPESLGDKVQFVPRIIPPEGDAYPRFSFQVGRERLYVVRNVERFLNSVASGETVRYGKSLSFCHAIGQFDASAQALIAVLMNEFRTFRTFERDDFLYDPYRSYGNRNEMELTGDAFDRWFDLLRGQEISWAGQDGAVLFQEGDPEIQVEILERKGGATIRVEADRQYLFFGNPRKLYALGEDVLLRCSRDFQKRVYPMLRGGAEKMRLSASDLPTFCSCVLPKIEDLVEVQDDGGLLQAYRPDECTPCYYIDIQDNGWLRARLAFRYGDQEIPCGAPISETETIKRDVAVESAAMEPLENALQLDREAGCFFLADEDAIMDFLLTQLEPLRAHGEVFVTDRLRARRIDTAKASVGVSVAGGLLTLDIDTGEFPPEELEALYRSLLKKRRYHRLSDGRYLVLDGSPYEALAEVAHMTQLSEKDLKSGRVTMPAYRGLYLDSVLGGSNVKVSRDTQFRTMVRNFKSVSESDYAVPDGLDEVLRPYQRVGFQWLKTLESSGFGGILADEMGLGKTVQVIAFFCTADRGTTGKPSLVVCPSSLVYNWAEELSRFAPQLQVRLILGTAQERRDQIAVDAGDVWVTSYDLLKRDIAQYAKKSFYCCVLDEGQMIKNQATLVSKAVKQVVCRQRFVLTGTPIENRLSELWNLFDFLMPGYLFSHERFVEKLEKPIAQSGDTEAQAQLSRLVQPFLLRRLKQDVLKELPPKIEHVRKIQLSELERKTYLAAAAAAKQTFAIGDQGKLQVLAALTQLRELCCDPNLCYENYTGGTSKLDACLELCAGMVENGHQILLFSQFTSMLDRIRARLDEQHISHYTLQGSTPKKQRAQLVKAFNAGGASVFLISLKAGGTGLNLTAADVVIHYDPWWNLAAQNQATDRAHRIGQQAHVQVYKLIAKDTIEEKILDLQARKAALMDVVTGNPDQSILAMSKEDLLALLE